MFKLDLEKLEGFIETEGDLVTALSSTIDNCHNAIINLTDNGFIGKSQFACMESFNDWVNLSTSMLDKLIYLQPALQEALTSANAIKKQFGELPSTLGGSTVVSPENTGIICLAVNSTLPAEARSVKDGPLQDSLDDIRKAKFKCYDLYFACDVANELSAYKAVCKEEKTKLESFSKDVAAYNSEVSKFESKVASDLKESLEEDFTLMKALDAIGVTASITEEGANIVGGVIKFSNKVTGNAVVSGKYLRLSGYHQGEGLTSRYLMETLANYPKAKALFRAGKWAKVGKVIEGIGVALDAIFVGVSAYDEYNRNPYLPEDRRLSDSISEAEVSTAVVGAETLGAWGGAIAGAALGTALFPGIGTVAGAFVGVIFGAVGSVGFAWGAGKAAEWGLTKLEIEEDKTIEDWWKDANYDNFLLQGEAIESGYYMPMPAY